MGYYLIVAGPGNNGQRKSDKNGKIANVCENLQFKLIEVAGILVDLFMFMLDSFNFTLIGSGIIG